MAKLKAPLMSFGASGKIAGSLVFFPWKGIDAVREYVVPANPRSALQQTQRGYLTDAVAVWHTAEYTDADRIAWNRKAGTLADIMSGFNAAMRQFILMRTAGQDVGLVSEVMVDTPAVDGFDVDVENSIAGYVIRARIGTSKTHFPTIEALADDGDGTYSLGWTGGVTNTDYYVYLERQSSGTYYAVTGIYHIKTS